MKRVIEEPIDDAGRLGASVRPLLAPPPAVHLPPVLAVPTHSHGRHFHPSASNLRPRSFIVHSDRTGETRVGRDGVNLKEQQWVHHQTCSRLCRRACGCCPQSARKRIGRLSLPGQHRPHGSRDRLCGLCGSARSLRSNRRAPWTLPNRRPPSRSLLRPCGRPPTVLRISRSLLRPCGRRPTVLRTDGRPPRAVPDCRPPTCLVRADGY